MVKVKVLRPFPIKQKAVNVNLSVGMTWSMEEKEAAERVKNKQVEIINVKSAAKKIEPKNDSKK